MPTDPTDPDRGIHVLGVCVFVLYVKFLGTTMIQGRKGFVAGTRLPEDGTLPMAKGLPTHHLMDMQMAILDETHQNAIEDEIRWRRIVQNDLESMPLAFVVFFLTLRIGGDSGTVEALVIAYTVARMAHTIAFARQYARLRMLAWLLGVLTIVASGVVGICGINAAD